MKKYFVIVFITLFLFACSEKKIDYNTQVKPIINKNCISCHGGVKKQSNYSLLFQEEAYAKGESGKVGIIPGDAANSEFIRRLTLHDAEERMPYKKDPLTDEEIEILTRWIDEGAEWGEHWAYTPVKKPQVPNVKSDWAKSNIDKFIVSNAEKHGLKPSPKASDDDLMRRTALDIIGYPATEELKKQYQKNKDFSAFVDKLLASTAYGEKWASMWLDLARYADSKGYERDGNRNIWRYRDWVIKALNDDMPYNQFVTEQLAGDLLPNPTDNQLIATAFHRNTMTNDEGGTDNEEFRNAALIDRVNTTWEALLSTTFACVQCHSHPYDQFTHEEYFATFAFFNNSRDEDTYADYPALRHFDSTQTLMLGKLDGQLRETVSKEQQKELISFLKTFQPAYNSIACDKFVNSELSDTKWLAMRNHSSARLKNVDLREKETLLMRYSFNVDGLLKIRRDKPDGEILASLNMKVNEKNRGWQPVEIPIKSSSGIHDIYFEYSSPKLSDPNANGITFDWFYFTEGLPKIAESKKLFWELLNAKTEQTPIMLDGKGVLSRKTHLFERGSWLSLGKEIEAGVPKTLGRMPNGSLKNRLGFSQWMTTKENPLFARTMVNRVWEQIFGVGLVETLEDFGSQGAEPSNQALLDYLAYRFMNDYNWSIKKLVREILLSATYQQSSDISPEQLQKDPYNIYLARGARVRLSAEQIRDQALAVSGVLNSEMFGRPVMPFQPEGVWNTPYNSDKWVQSVDGQQYRRAIYTFVKRSAPYPSMVSFDSPGREVCTARRIRTNTPLQALVTLNDSTFIDIAAHLAKKAMLSEKNNPQKSIATAYYWASGKKISAEKLDILNKLYQKAYLQYKKNPDLCRTFSGGDKPELAAMILVGNSILNLDEVISKT